MFGRLFGPAESFGEARNSFWIDGEGDHVVVCVDFSSDGSRVIAGLDPKSIWVWDVQRGREIRRFEEDTNSTLNVTLSADGSRALSLDDTSSDEDTEVNLVIRLWDVESESEICSFDASTQDTSCAAFSPDGRHALTGGYDGSVCLWDLESGREVHRFEGHKYVVNCVAFSPDGRRAISGAIDSYLRLWDVESEREIWHYTVSGGANCVAFAPDGHHVLYGSGDGSMGLLNADARRLVRHFGGFFTGRGIRPSCVTFSPDGSKALSGGINGAVCLWEVESGREIRRFQKHDDWVVAVAFSPDGQIGVSGGIDGAVRLWDLPLL